MRDEENRDNFAFDDDTSDDDTSTEEEDSSDSDDNQLPECRTELVSSDDDDYQLPACSAELASDDEEDSPNDSSSTESTHEADAEVARVFSRGRPLQPTMTTTKKRPMGKGEKMTMKKRTMGKAATDRAIAKKIARFVEKS